ncbi:MAG: Hpt domain-containing protein [Treponema sp.]|jgi:HPt (histidine-containing phosphotransfer) domain-containing protein|nr:Hpt domain-containing protein [Treponema sp.]
MSVADAVYINFEEGLKRVMNNTKLYVRLLTKFRTDTRLDELSAQIGAGDYEKAQVAAHTLKGVVANLSLIELFEKIRDLESQIKEKAVQPGALDTVKTVFDETLKKVDEVIAQYGS